MRKKRNIIIIISSVFLVIILFYLFRDKSESTGDSPIEIEVKKGNFDVKVVTTGELQSENSEKIIGPSGLQRLWIYEVKITDLIPEGTVVDSGDYVATLDRTEVESKLKDVETELQKNESQYIKTQLDTALELRAARDEMINLKYAMEESNLTLEQSKFEPPATIRQNKISYEKAERAFDQAKKNYKLKVEQSIAKMVEVSANLEAEKRKKDDLVKIQDEFVVRAPKSGMVIYMKEWGGTKRKVGSSISPWNNVVATLPDLSSMISKTYINEIDISKVKVGQIVQIGVDAFPDKKFEGKITEVANVGEQLPNSDAKVFEVTIQMNEADTALRPSMTTSNTILVNSYKDVIAIPLEAVRSNDSLSYVYVKDGFSYKKQIVELGESNENEIIVERGIDVGNVILLSNLSDEDKLEIAGIEIYNDIKKKKIEMQKKQEALKDSLKRNKPDDKGNKPFPNGNGNFFKKNK